MKTFFCEHLEVKTGDTPLDATPETWFVTPMLDSLLNVPQPTFRPE